MKKWLVFILLLSHVNFTMFIAQVDEWDTYDKKGRQLEDVNSLTEYIADIVGGNHEQNTHDEDDDNARYFHLEKLTDYSCFQQYIEIKRTAFVPVVKTHYPPLDEARLSSVFSEKPTPPPKA